MKPSVSIIKYLCLLVWISGLLFLVSGCYPFKAVYLGKPDNSDYKHLKNVTIPKASNTPLFSFYASAKELNLGEKIYVNDRSKNVNNFRPLKEMLVAQQNNAFLIIRNDTLLFENYERGFDENSLHASYSVAKPFTAALLSIAIQEGFIKNENEKAIQYLPELSEYPEAQKLTLKHLLNHTSGLKGKMLVDAHLYYGNDIWKGIKKMEFERPPGTKMHYANINTQLLGLIIERATKQKLSNYLAQKLWQPLGMESDALWSVDKNGYTKSFCCLSATAKDFAKLGRLYLNNGNWQGKQIIDEEWVTKSRKRDNSEGSSFSYNYCWRVGLKEYGDFMAPGMYEQFIYVNPQKQLLIIALNGRENNLRMARLNWIHLFREITDQL